MGHIYKRREGKRKEGKGKREGKGRDALNWGLHPPVEERRVEELGLGRPNSFFSL